MFPQVLVRNPHVLAQDLPLGLVPTSWDAGCFWMGEEFSFFRLFESGSAPDLSPFFVLEARHAFLISLLDIESDTFLAGMSELSCMMYFLRSRGRMFSTTSFAHHLDEYSRRDFVPDPDHKNFSQMIIFGEHPEPYLDLLMPSGRAFLASSVTLPAIPVGFILEHEWKYEDYSEIGKLYVLQVSRNNCQFGQERL